jgi:hypothetical protein
MEFLKKNYEKVLLAVVLLGLTVAACLLPLIIQSKREKLTEYTTELLRPKIKPIAPLDMAELDAANQRASTPLKLDFTTRHNTFNPVLWKKVDGQLLKEQTGNEEVEALEITKITPLFLEISYGSQSGSGYLINIDNQSETSESRRHSQRLVNRESKGPLTLQDVKGPPDKPTELDMIWNDTGEGVVITPEKSFRKVDGYAADLKYKLENNKTWTDRRVGSILKFANGTYKIVVITELNVVISAQPIEKKTTITFHPAPEPR